MSRAALIGIALVPILAVTGCGGSGNGTAKSTPLRQAGPTKSVGQSFQLTDGNGDTARLALQAVANPRHVEVDVQHPADTHVFGLTMHLQAVTGGPGYSSAPVVTGTNHRTYYANSNSSPPEPTDITVTMPRHVRIACVRDTIDGGTRNAAWRVSSPGC